MEGAPADPAALASYPKLLALVNRLDEHLTAEYPEFFRDGTRPHLPLKRAKVMHDGLWGTVRYSWQELAFLDTPLLQRLRDIHQVGLAFQVYPSARHSRFEHTLGVVTVASRIFDGLLQRNRHTFAEIVKNLDDTIDVADGILKLKQELRLAAVFHDVGHSLFSHASEKVFRDITLLKDASLELSDFVGKEKGEGEVVSFCLVLAPCVRRFLDQAKQRGLIEEPSSEDYSGSIDFVNVALFIVGRSRHPHLQFLADIISSEIDADKLDYLRRDATTAGLPLSYDIDMYLHSVRLEESVLADGEGGLQTLYAAVNETGIPPDRTSAEGYPLFDTYRLRLPKKAMHVIEQIVLCKLMLFSYMYHHPKVRAAEGFLERTLRRYVDEQRKSGVNEETILCEFLRLTDSAVHCPSEILKNCPILAGNLVRLRDRLLPREIFRISASEASGAPAKLLSKFLAKLQDRESGKLELRKFETAIGTNLVVSGVASSAEEALFTAGVWVDLPKAPQFEDTRHLVVNGDGLHEELAGKLFPIGEWQHAYTHYRYYMRIYAFSEFVSQATEAAKAAMEKTIGITDPAFYRNIRRRRD